MPTISETRGVSNFNEIALQGYGDLTIVQNPDAPESLVIEADQDLMSRLTSEVRNGKLILGFDMPWYDWLGWGLEWLFTPNKAIRYHISLKQFNGVALSGAANLSAGKLQGGAVKLVVSGAGKVRIGELQAQSLATTISGSGDIEIGAGSVPQHDLHISGSGSVKAAAMQTAETRVAVSGAGSAEVDARQTLDVHISGAGSVHYNGSPVVNQQISGAGSVKPLH